MAKLVRENLTQKKKKKRKEKFIIHFHEEYCSIMIKVFIIS